MFVDILFIIKLNEKVLAIVDIESRKEICLSCKITTDLGTYQYSILRSKLNKNLLGVM